MTLPRGAGAISWVCLDGGTAPCNAPPVVLAANGCAANGTDCIALLSLEDAKGTTVDYSTVIFNIPASLALPVVDVEWEYAQPQPDGSVPLVIQVSNLPLACLLQL